VINGDLGLYPGTSVTGFPPGIINGVSNIANAIAEAAQIESFNLYNALTALPCQFDLTGMDLGGMILPPAVYCFNSSAQLTGILTLLGNGNPNSIWVFQIGSTLTTVTGSSVVYSNILNPNACQVYWAVGSSATFGTFTSFIGIVDAVDSITFNTGASLVGKALALNAAITFDDNLISVCSQTCGLPPSSTTRTLT